MAMTGLEKRLVNRPKKAQRNIMKISAHLEGIAMGQVKNALEIGCGIGTVSSWLADSYDLTVIGTDFDSDQIKVAKEMYPEHDQLRFKIEDGANLSFEKEFFDLVISENVFHHISNWRAAIGEVARVLKPSGYFIWFDLVFPDWLRGFFRRFLKDYGFYTITDIDSEFAKNGFRTLNKTRIRHGPMVHYDIMLQRE
ncbi:MAG: class I SAM-dependent methyltransferase [Anaerolineales bacterium]|jgi:ubiquinone/menaquinone biosynthesis C-methylase UbiE